MIICYTVAETWHVTDAIAFFFNFGLFFALFPRDIIILQMYTKNYDQMMYGS